MQSDDQWQKQNIIRLISEYAYQLKHDIQKLLIKLKNKEKPPAVPDVKLHQKFLDNSIELQRTDNRERREKQFANFDLQHATMYATRINSIASSFLTQESIKRNLKRD